MNYEFIKPKTIPIISKHLGIDAKELENYYSEFELVNNKKLEKPFEGFLSIEKNININFISPKTTMNWNKSTLIGIDLPIHIKSRSSNDESIMIVGIDPLRKRKDFPNFNPNEVIIGTPYALHSSYYRENKGRTKIYADFIENLTQKYNCYITDIYKVWMNNITKSEGVKFSLNKENKIYGELLSEEIESTKPTKIIAFGNLAYDAINRLKVHIQLEVPVIKLPHPSGANRKWNELIKGKATFDKKLEYLNNEFKKGKSH